VVLRHSRCVTAVFVNMAFSDEYKSLTSGQFELVYRKRDLFQAQAMENRLFSEPSLISNGFFLRNSVHQAWLLLGGTTVSVC